jgi:hypothetical protein
MCPGKGGSWYRSACAQVNRVPHSVIEASRSVSEARPCGGLRSFRGPTRTGARAEAASVRVVLMGLRHGPRDELVTAGAAFATLPSGSMASSHDPIWLFVAHAIGTVPVVAGLARRSEVLDCVVVTVAVEVVHDQRARLRPISRCPRNRTATAMTQVIASADRFPENHPVLRDVGRVCSERMIWLVEHSVLGRDGFLPPCRIAAGRRAVLADECR